MAQYKEEIAGRRGSTYKIFDAVVRHVYPTRRAMAIFLAALSKPLTVVPATLGRLFLATRKISYCKTLIIGSSRA